MEEFKLPEKKAESLEENIVNLFMRGELSLSTIDFSKIMLNHRMCTIASEIKSISEKIINNHGHK